MLDLVREHGVPGRGAELVESDPMPPDVNLTLEEARTLFVEGSIVPG